MKPFVSKLNILFKDFIFFLRPGVFFHFISGFLLLISNTLRLTKWMSRQPRQGLLNDFYTPYRRYSKRYDLYEHVVKTEILKDTAIDYLEFGVAKGYSFRWWTENNTHKNSRFYGFDTFEGLPEAWGRFSKGDMAFAIPESSDNRHEFIKGLFQQTVPGFIESKKLNTQNRKVIHLDADLFSSTLYVLTSLHGYLKKGDILLFDEFNVPNHEFFAFDCYVKAYYVKYKLLGAVNNYFQVALMLE